MMAIVASVVFFTSVMVGGVIPKDDSYKTPPHFEQHVEEDGQG